MDSISVTLKTLKFIMSVNEWRRLCYLTSFVLVMIASFAISIFYVLSLDFSLSTSVLLSLSIVIIFFVIVGLRFRSMILRKSSTFLQSIRLKSVLTLEDIWKFQFALPTCPNRPFLEIEWPTVYRHNEKILLHGFVPEFVIIHCLIKAEKYYAKENEPSAR